jgi:peptidoglycan/LPS O-acetylase OafA/YrhL
VVVFFAHALDAATTNRALIIGARDCLSVFYALSGFLITRLIVKGESGNIFRDLRTFYIRRVLRLAPLYYVFLTALVVFARVKYPLLLYLYIFNVKVFLTNRWTDCASHFWSLCIEEQFYFLFPITLLLTPKRFRLGATVALILVCHVIGLIGPAVHPAFKWSASLPVCGQYILWGCLVGLLDTRLEKSVNLDRLFFPSVFIFAALYLLDAIARVPVSGVFYAPVIGVLVFSLWRLNNRHVLKFTCNPVTAYLGKISYALYLFHLPLLWYAYNIRPEVLKIPVTLSLTIGLAALSWHMFELPISKWKDRFTFKGEPEVKQRSIPEMAVAGNA